jgi:hypothetical protein
MGGASMDTIRRASANSVRHSPTGTSVVIRKNRSLRYGAMHRFSAEFSLWVTRRPGRLWCRSQNCMRLNNQVATARVLKMNDTLSSRRPGTPLAVLTHSANA